MKLKYKTLLVVLILAVKAFVIAEAPPEPSLRTVCSDSELIIAATAVKECGESLYDPPIKYLCYEFNVDEIYHGEYDKACIRVAIPVEETYNPNGGSHIDGAYVITGCRIAEKYLLFLKPYKKGYYGRVDEMWAITKYDSQTVEKIKEELAGIKADRPKPKESNIFLFSAIGFPAVIIVVVYYARNNVKKLWRLMSNCL